MTISVYILALLTITVVVADCPVGYQIFESSCYKVDNTTATRSDAADVCTSDNAHLTDITSSEEQDFIAGLLANTSGRGKDAWIGLAVQDPGGVLMWSDGSYPEFTAWSEKQTPDREAARGRDRDADNKRCVRMSRKKGYQWNFRECSKRHILVCEFELELAEDLTVETSLPASSVLLYLTEPNRPLFASSHSSLTSNSQFTTSHPFTTNLPMCSAPKATIINKRPNVLSALAYTKRMTFTLQGRVNATCKHRVTYGFDWSIRKHAFDDFNLKSGEIIGFPNSVNTRETELIVPQDSLGYGFYRFQFAVVLMQNGRMISFGQDETWIEIVKSELVAVIAGGSARSYGSSVPLVMDASDSYDPDDVEGVYRNIKFTWFCQKQRKNVEILTGYDILLHKPSNVNGTNLCFDDNIRLPHTGAVWEHDGVLAEGDTYVFTIMLSKMDRQSVFAEQRLTILRGNPPQLKVRCSQNCGRLIAEKRLVLSVECTAECGTDASTLLYSWDIISPDGRVISYGNRPSCIEDQFNWKKQTSTTGTESAYLVVNAGMFLVDDDEIESVRVTGRKISGASGYSEYTIKVNKPPSAGICQVDPIAGYVLQTQFIVACEMFKDEDDPLTYTVMADTAAEDTNSNDLSLVLYSGLEAKSPSLYLPLGSADKDYIVMLSVEVKDLLGATTTIALNATVLPPEIDNLVDSTNYLLDMSTGTDSELAGLLNIGDYQTAMQVIGAIGSILSMQLEHNKTEDDDGKMKRNMKHTQIREALVSSVADVPVQSVVALRQTSATLALVTQEKSEVTQTAQFQAATSFTRMGSFLKAQSSAGTEGQDTIEGAATIIVSGLSNILDAAAITTTAATFNTVNATSDGGQNENDTVLILQKSRYVSMETLSALTEVQDAVAANKVPAEEPTIIATSTMTMSVSRQDRGALSAMPVRAGRNSGSVFSLPVIDSIEQYLPTNYTGSIDTHLVEMFLNPFAWSESSDTITSTVIGMQLKTTAHQRIKLENLTANVDIFVPVLSKTEQDALSLIVNLTVDGVAVVVFNVSDPNSTQHVVILPEGNIGVHLLCCLMYADENVTSSTPCDRNTTLPLGLSVKERFATEINFDEADYTWTFPPGFLSTPGSYQIVVSIYNDTDSLVDVALSLRSHVLSSDCVFWDEIEESWSNKGCKVGAFTTRYQTHCQCNHLSYFTSNFLVMPNKVNFLADSKLFLTFVDNPLVVSTVVAILVVYVITAVWARRKDKEDELKTSVIVLPDSDPYAHYRYTVTIMTGIRRGAGTSATVTITLMGDRQSSLSHVLQNRQRPILQRGSVESFLITTRESLGELKEIRIWHDNSGTHPGWYLNRIVVHDLETDERWLCICNTWLAVDMGDGQIDFSVKVATDEQLKEFGNLFSDRTTRGLTDGHLWFSVFSRPARSHFTRLQRLSCCIALLMTTMLSSIMFYGVPNDPADQVMDFGTFRVSIREIIISIESSIIAFPINLLIVQIFRMAQQQQSKVPHQKKKQSKKSKVDAKESAVEVDKESSASSKHSRKGNLSPCQGTSLKKKEKQSKKSKVDAKESAVEVDKESSVSSKRSRGGNLSPCQGTSLSDAAKQTVQDNGSLNKTDIKGENNSVELDQVNFDSSNLEIVEKKTQTDTSSEIFSNDTTSSYSADANLSSRSSSDQLSAQRYIQDVSTSESAQSLLGNSSTSHDASDQSLSITKEVKDISSSGSLFEISLPNSGLDKQLGISSWRCSERYSQQSSSQSDNDSFTKSYSDTSSSTSSIRKETGPVTHNDILYRKLEEIVIDLENMSPENFSSEKEYLNAKEEVKGLILTAKSIRTPSLTSSSNLNSSSEHEISSSRLRCILPHWCIYIGWLILVLTILVSAFFVMLYGLKYGKQRSLDWLVSLFLSTFQSVFISQPLKVLLFAAFVALVFKTWEDDDDGSEDVEEIYIETMNADYEYKLMMERRRKSAWYKPPLTAIVGVARLRKMRERKMYALLRELCGYVFFVWLVLLLAYSHRDRNAYFLTKHTKDLYFNNKIYRQMKDLSKFFVWADKVLIPSLYEEEYGSDFQSALLGGVRLRQVRVHHNSCNVEPLFQNQIDKCNAPYSVINEDTSSYISSWKQISYDQSQTHDPWAYHPDLARRFWGQLTTYESGGYKTVLGNTLTEARATLFQLQESLWLDDRTRALFVEWTVYNANTNLFGVVSFTIEMPATGGIHKYPYIQSVRLYRYTANFQAFILAIELIFALHIIYYTYAEILKYRQEGNQYFRSIWNWVDMTSILISFIIIVVYIYRYVVTKQLHLKTSFDEFVSFYLAANVDDIFSYLLSFLVVICTIKFLHLLRLNPRMYLLTTVLSRAYLELIAFSILLLVYICSFTVLTNLVFGPYLRSYHTYNMAFSNLFNLLLGTFNHRELMAVNGYLSPLIVIVYEFVALYLLLNLFIAALSLAMVDVRRVPKYSEDGKLGLLLIDKILSLLGIDNRKLQRHLNT